MYGHRKREDYGDGIVQNEDGIDGRKRIKVEHNEEVMLQPTDGSERILKGHDEKVILKPSDERKKNGKRKGCLGMKWKWEGDAPAF